MTRKRFSLILARLKFSETTMDNNNNQHEDHEDEFFGNANDENDDRLAEQESNAVSAKLSSLAYLDAFDDSKEVRLQEGFESGFFEVFHFAESLGRKLGILSARAKVQQQQVWKDDSGTASREEVAAKQASRTCRAVMDKINRGLETPQDATKLFISLEDEINQLQGRGTNFIL